MDFNHNVNKKLNDVKTDFTLKVTVLNFVQKCHTEVYISVGIK